MIYVNIPDEALVLKYARFTPSGSAREPDAASCESTAERRWMMDAFSNASEVWVVGLVVKASFLPVSSDTRGTETTTAYQVKETFISEKRNSSNSS